MGARKRSAAQIDGWFGFVAGSFGHDCEFRSVGLESSLEQTRHLLHVRPNCRCRIAVRQNDLILARAFVGDHQQRGTELVRYLFIQRTHLVTPHWCHRQEIGTVIALHDFLRVLLFSLLDEN